VFSQLLALGHRTRSSINCGVVIREAQSIPNPWTSLGLPTSVFLLARSGNRLGRLFLLVCWRSRGPRHCAFHPLLHWVKNADNQMEFPNFQPDHRVCFVARRIRTGVLRSFGRLARN
jgi:hypothetical protein